MTIPRETISLLHAIAGILIALTGLLQFVLRKGGKFHHVLGHIYFWSWAIVVSTGIYLGSLLIGFLGLLGWYMAATAYVFGIRRRNGSTLVLRIMIIVALLIAFFTLGWGIYLLFRGSMFFGAVSVFFGIVFLLNIRMDILEYIMGRLLRRTSASPLHWLFEHYGRMFISYIAAMTAFTVIQNVFPIGILNWLMPTFIGVAVLIGMNRYYYKKYGVFKNRG